MATQKGIALFGNFGTGNFGNDGSLEAMLSSLRRVAPDDALCCICGNPAAVGAEFNLPAYPINFGSQVSNGGRLPLLVRKTVNKLLMWPYAIRRLKTLKAIVVPGTGILDDFRIGPFGWPYDLFCWFVLARLMGVKVMLVSIGAGPIRSPLSRWFLKAAAGAAYFRSYRDDASKSFMAGIGMDRPADPVFPDLAFGLPAPPNVTGDRGRPTVVGVGLMTYYGWRKNAADGDAVYDSYIAKMATYVRWLLSEGHRVRIMMGDESDETAVQDLIAALEKSGDSRRDDAVAFAPAHTLMEIMHQMADIDIAVATRFHNVVCALRMGKPTISVSYAPKNDVLLTEMGLDGFSQHIEWLDVEVLKSQTSRLLKDRIAFGNKIRMACARYDAALREQEQLLGRFLRTTKSS